MIKNGEKLPLPGEKKRSIEYLPSGKKNEGTSNQDLQNQECGE